MKAEIAILLLLVALAIVVGVVLSPAMITLSDPVSDV